MVFGRELRLTDSRRRFSVLRIGKGETKSADANLRPQRGRVVVTPRAQQHEADGAVVLLPRL